MSASTLFLFFKIAIPWFLLAYVSDLSALFPGTFPRMKCTTISLPSGSFSALQFSALQFSAPIWMWGDWDREEIGIHPPATFQSTSSSIEDEWMSHPFTDVGPTSPSQGADWWGETRTFFSFFFFFFNHGLLWFRKASFTEAWVDSS